MPKTEEEKIEEEKAAWDKFTDEIIKAGGIEEWHGRLQCMVCLGDVFGKRGKAANYTYWKILCKNGDERYCRNMPAEYIQKLGLSESLAKMYGRPLGYTRHEGRGGRL